MAGPVFNTSKGVNGDVYAGGNQGFNKSVQQVRKYDKVLLTMLNMGEALGNTRHLIHKMMPMHLGDAINQRRYFTLSADPVGLKLDKELITGPELKRMQGAAVEAKLEWYGNGIALNDYLKATHLDNLMAIYLPVLYKNAREVMDNIAGLAVFDGASKAYVGAYNDTTGATTLVDPIDPAAVANTVKGPLNLTIINHITNKMLTNVEEYTVPDAAGTGTVTIKVPARINPIKGARYVVMAGPNGLTDLISSKIFKDDFVHGISAQELRDNKIFDSYRFTFEEVSNFLTMFSTVALATASGEKTAAGAAKTQAGSLSVNWAGDLEVAFIFGKEYGFDVKMAGQGLKVYTKTDNTADSGDVYGRLNFVTYKMAYVAKVSNSMAVYAVVYKPGTLVTDADKIKAPADAAHGLAPLM